MQATGANREGTTRPLCGWGNGASGNWGRGEFRAEVRPRCSREKLSPGSGPESAGLREDPKERRPEPAPPPCQGGAEITGWGTARHPVPSSTQGDPGPNPSPPLSRAAASHGSPHPSATLTSHCHLACAHTLSPPGSPFPGLPFRLPWHLLPEAFLALLIAQKQTFSCRPDTSYHTCLLPHIVGSCAWGLSSPPGALVGPGVGSWLVDSAPGGPHRPQSG